MTPAEIEHLRARARALRRTAAAVRDCAAARLTALADEVTWFGPTAQRCLDDLHVVRRQAGDAERQLRQQADRLDARADAASVEVVRS